MSNSKTPHDIRRAGFFSLPVNRPEYFFARFP